MNKELMKTNTTEMQMWESNERLVQIKKTFGKDLTTQEFDLFVNIGKATGLNPFLREIWAVKYGNSAANIFIGRDGYRKGAQANPEYDFHHVDAVYSNDEFHYDPLEGKVQHRYSFPDRGKLIGAYCMTKRRSSSRMHYVFVERSEYDTGKSVWKDKPATMIKKVAEAQCLRMAFQELFAGTYSEYEMNLDPHGKPLPSMNERVNDLNQKFGLDDEKEFVNVETGEVEQVIMASVSQVKELEALIGLGKVPQKTIDKWLSLAKAETYEQMTSDQIEKCIQFIKNRIEHAEMEQSQ